MRQNERVRKLLISTVTVVVALALAALAVDFGTSIYAEYRLSRTVRTAAHLDWNPSVAILGFPFINQAVNRHFDEVEIKAYDVAHVQVERATLEATMHNLDLAQASWLVRPDAPIPVGKLENKNDITNLNQRRVYEWRCSPNRKRCHYWQRSIWVYGRPLCSARQFEPHFDYGERLWRPG